MTEPAFTIFPAIDLRGGEVVRLAQGDPARQTTYAADPAAVARRWRAEGAEWLHVVNLDGAFGDEAAIHSPNALALTALLGVGLKVQFGGGLRDEPTLRRVFAAGVSRVVLGTVAVENPTLVDWALGKYGPERVAVGIDARAGKVRLRGWTEEAALTALALGQRLRQQGVAWCVFTDVARDGLGTGVNLAATAELARATGLRVVASGGAATSADVSQVRAAGLAGIILGRALYEGRIDLGKVLRDA
jgi:phosphoribosylformimino-5-aminoimidazole carboxamide ribotide isomerase